MDSPSPQAPDQEPANLRFLRRLVTLLTVVMIAGFLLLIALLVSRLTGPEPLALPDTITLPDGAEAAAFTIGPDWYAVVTQDSRILIIDRTSGALRQEIDIGAN